MNAYFISGLGADKRIFSRIKLDERIHVIHVEWIKPLKKESLPDYAKRLSEIVDVSSPFILVGVSFGGMIAVEMAKTLNPKLTLVISSTVLSDELPFMYRLVGKFGLIKLIPSWILKSSNKITGNYFFGANTIEEKILLSKIIADTNPKFLKWAIGSIITWQNAIKPNNLVQIHGKSDRILYSKAAKVDYIINKGTHFMIYQNARKISEIINKLISKFI
ncbi:alpha/beta hydrolase [Pedobacter sp. R20-19]|uniref:alpha/beta hydrolase n=1 Tax=Pedobacter sp. R20-19 TaxID=1270196 RepID=UPI000493595C|nr:alpha/beta hydrolase [Pedobacter sp. R20-19]